MARFDETYCSQCGGSFGPGDSGYSHCIDHYKVTLKIRTSYRLQPIPTNAFDWSAVTDDYEADHPQGHGATETEAVMDLIEQIDERRSAEVEEKKEADERRAARRYNDWADTPWGRAAARLQKQFSAE